MEAPDLSNSVKLAPVDNQRETLPYYVAFWLLGFRANAAAIFQINFRLESFYFVAVGSPLPTTSNA